MMHGRGVSPLPVKIERMITLKTIQDGITLGKAKVIVDIVAKGNPEIRPETPMNPTEICVHNTGNDGKGANAEAHNKYIHNMANLSPKDTGYASWHFSVDNVNIYQHIPTDECAWHTGDGSGAKSGNRNAIGIEICENKDMTPAQYKQAEENAIALVVHLMDLYDIKLDKVKCHQMYSGKFCPRVILKRDGSFTAFHNRIKKAYEAKNKKTSAKPTSKPVEVSQTVEELPSNVYGVLEIICEQLNVREEASFKSTVVKVVKKGEEYKVYGQKNGLYNIGNKQYVSAGTEYVKFTKNPNYGVTKPKLVEVIVSELYTYKTADWDDKGQIVKKGEVFTIAQELMVKGSKMYKLKSGLYITANTKYVKVK